MELVVPNGRLFNTQYGDGSALLWIKISDWQDDRDWLSVPALVLSGRGRNVSLWDQTSINERHIRLTWEPSDSQERSLQPNEML